MLRLLLLDTKKCVSTSEISTAGHWAAGSACHRLAVAVVVVVVVVVVLTVSTVMQTDIQSIRKDFTITITLRLS